MKHIIEDEEEIKQPSAEVQHELKEEEKQADGDEDSYHYQNVNVRDPFAPDPSLLVHLDKSEDPP